MPGMPKKLLRDINTLIALQEKLNSRKNIQHALDIDILVEASEKSSKLYEDLWREFERMDNEPLKGLFDNLFKITYELHSIAGMNHPKPSLGILNKVTDSFENFLDHLVTRPNRKKFRKAIAKVRIVDDILFHCGNIPHYWNDASGIERLGLLLGALIVVSAIALTIAAFANPAVGHVFGGGFGIGLIASLGMSIYTFALLGAKEKLEDKERVQKSLHRLEEQQENLEHFVKNNLQTYKIKQEFLIKHQTQQINNAKLEPYNSHSLPKTRPNNYNGPKQKTD